MCPLRWKNWWVRGILTLAMISFFFFIIYLGPMVLMMIVSIRNSLVQPCFHNKLDMKYPDPATIELLQDVAYLRVKISKQ